jgi:hypothetical protein
MIAADVKSKAAAILRFWFTEIGNASGSVCLINVSPFRLQTGWGDGAARNRAFSHSLAFSRRLLELPGAEFAGNRLRPD